MQTAPEVSELPACKKARSVPADVLAPLQTGPVLKAEEYLQTLPAQRGVDQLRYVLQQWRAAGTLADKHAQLNQLRRVAAELGVPLSRGVSNDSGTVSRAIADGFTDRVSALRTFVESSAGATPGRMAATAIVAAQVATRGSGAGELAGGREALAESGASKGEHDSEKSDGGDNLAENARVGFSLTAEPVVGIGAGPVAEARGAKRGPLPRLGSRTNRQKAIGEGRADSSAHAPPQESLTWYMSPKTDDTQIASARPLRFEDIVTIEEASMFARDMTHTSPGSCCGACGTSEDI